MLVRTMVAVTILFSLLTSEGLKAQNTVTQADLNRVRSEIELLKQDIDIKQAELRMLELQMARQSNMPSPKPEVKPATPEKPVAPAPVSAPPAQAKAMPAPRRSDIDPAPYEAAITQRVAMFRTNDASKWLVLDEKRLVYWVLDDEAYLLHLAQTCSGLLTSTRLKVENFSTRVKAGHDSVIFDDQRCLIESISKLGGRSLPKPPRK